MEENKELKVRVYYNPEHRIFTPIEQGDIELINKMKNKKGYFYLGCFDYISYRELLICGPNVTRHYGYKRVDYKIFADKIDDLEYCCPICGDNVFPNNKYCSNCGQMIDFE